MIAPSIPLLWDALPDALLIVTESVVVAANPAAVLLLAPGAPTCLPGFPLDRLFPPDSQPLISGRLAHLRSGGHPLNSVPERIIRLDGEERDVELSIAALPGLDQVLLAIRDVTERHKVEAALAFTAGQLRALAKRQDALVEEERQRIAREIHDDLGQQLTLAKLRLAALRPDASPALASGLDDASSTLDSAIRTVRRIATALRPAVLDALGLSAAVEWQTRVFREQTGITVETGQIDELVLDDATSTALFRILQEALTNIARHSRAKLASVSLYRASADVVLEVEDFGIGMPAIADRTGDSLGLIGMRERATLLGGSLSIFSSPGQGTRLVCRVPFTASARAAEAGGSTA
jgi:two-component system, NarL family, sensor histidine kinase UhpB